MHLMVHGVTAFTLGTSKLFAFQAVSFVGTDTQANVLSSKLYIHDAGGSRAALDRVKRGK